MFESVSRMTTATHENEYLSIGEVAHELRVSEGTVRRRIRAGELPATQLGGPGSAVRIPRAALDAWLWAAGDEVRA